MQHTIKETDLVLSLFFGKERRGMWNPHGAAMLFPTIDPIASFKDMVNDAMDQAVQGSLMELQSDLSTLLGNATEKLSLSPSSYNGTIFGLVENVNKTVMIPIAVIIMTYVLAYELIQMLIEKNNMVELEVGSILKWLFKAFITIELLANSWTITMALFDVGVGVVTSASGVSNNISMQSVTLTMDSIAGANIGTKLLAWIECWLFKMVVKIVAIMVSVYVIFRMMEIYIYSSAAAIPYATLGNGETRGIGAGYIKTICGLAFQGFFMILILSIFSVLVQQEFQSGDVFKIFPKIAVYLIVLVISLKKSGQIAKDIFTGT